MHVYHTMKFSGLEDVIITSMEEGEGTWKLAVELPERRRTCPQCGEKTNRIHDYRTQKIEHLKIFERWTVLLYRK